METTNKIMSEMTREELIIEFKFIINSLINRGFCRYNPIRNMKYLNKQMLRDGVTIYGDKLENIRKEVNKQ